MTFYFRSVEELFHYEEMRASDWISALLDQLESVALEKSNGYSSILGEVPAITPMNQQFENIMESQINAIK